MTAPAGWYQDPSVAGFVRYWDGVQWSHHTAAAQGWPGAVAGGAGEADTGPSSVMHYLLPVGRSWQSVTAPYLGLFSLLPIPIIGQALGAGAITLGIIALRRSKSGGHGTGRAVTAIVLGTIGVLFSTIVSVTLLMSN